MSYAPRPPRPPRSRLTLLAGAVALATTACGGSETPDDATPAPSAVESTPVELLDPTAFDTAVAAGPETTLINVHIPYEDHIEGTDAFIPFDSILESNDLPTDTDAPIALYCRSGNMSAQASADLVEAGYTNIIDLDGGMNAWEADGNELVDDPTVTG